MAIAQKATIENNKIKMMVWGEPGAGKTRFALSAPNPLVIDLENSTDWYSNEFNFMVAKVNEQNKLTKNATILTHSIVEEIIKGEYKDIETLVIDPVTDLLESIETICTKEYENKVLNNKQVIELNPLQKSKFYAFRRDKTREMISRILNLDLNIIFIARAKNVWGKSDGQMTVTGKTFDGLDILEYLPDVVFNLRNIDNKTIAEVKKSRIGITEKSIEIKGFETIKNIIRDKYKIIKLDKEAV